MANIKNLRSGHISPQFHVAVDKLFQTIFTSGGDDVMIDVIWNQLFEDKQSLHAKDEFNAEGELIYSSPQ